MGTIRNLKENIDITCGFGWDEWRIAVTNGEHEYSYMNVHDLVANWADVVENPVPENVIEGEVVE